MDTRPSTPVSFPMGHSGSNFPGANVCSNPEAFGSRPMAPSMISTQVSAAPVCSSSIRRRVRVSIRGRICSARPIRAGEVVLQETAQLAVVDRADIFEAFGLANQPRMLMGTNLLKNRVLSISYGRSTRFVQ